MPLRIASNACQPICSTCSNEPWRKLRVGRMPAALSPSVRPGVPLVRRSQPWGWSGMDLDSRLPSSPSAAGSCARSAYLRDPLTAIARTFLEPITAPMPVRPL